MKRFAAAALASCAAMSAHAETLWVGNAFVTAATQPTCGTAANVGDYARVIFRPAGVPLGNGGNSYLAYLGQRSNFTITAVGNSFQSGINYAGQYVSSYINFGANAGGITAWALTPAAISASQQNYALTGTFANFFGVAGCTVSVQADLELMP